jgi:hypothetical protein
VEFDRFVVLVLVGFGVVLVACALAVAFVGR